MTHINRRNGPFSLSGPYDLLNRIDQKRGDISRSKFILRIVEKDLSLNSTKPGTLYKSKKMPADDPAGCNHTSDILLKGRDSN